MVDFIGFISPIRDSLSIWCIKMVILYFFLLLTEGKACTWEPRNQHKSRKRIGMSINVSTASDMCIYTGGEVWWRVPGVGVTVIWPGTNVWPTLTDWCSVGNCVFGNCLICTVSWYVATWFFCLLRLGLSNPRIPDWHLSQPWYFVQFWEELEMNHREVFTIMEKATRAFSLLKSANTTFTFKNLLRHYAKQVLTGCK